MDDWSRLTSKLGARSEEVFLTAIANKGFGLLGRGAVAIDTNPDEHRFAIGYCALSWWETALGDDGAIEMVREYDPTKEMVVIVISKKNIGFRDGEPTHAVVVFRVPQATQGSAEAVRLAAEALVVAPKKALEGTERRETLERLFEKS